ncbi:MAG TPA: heat-inducible transcriptional repressor HrcA [Patescibacteria group bacterium]|nr:heat-inducible transcriptional repressor HrcA [Patescibacteria group bacterium]
MKTITVHDISLQERKLLKRVVDLFIETGRPVSSLMLKRHYGLETSTAHIRKSLHVLEDRGLLYKPHVSAGRVPSDAGYRLYVNDIRNINPLNGKVVEEIRRKIGQDFNDIREVMLRTSHLLGELTNYMGFILGVFNCGHVVEKLRIVQLEGTAGLVILTLEPQQERKVLVMFPKRYRSHIIDRAVQIINERIAGYPLTAAPRRLEDVARDGIGIEREIAQAVRNEAEYLFDLAYELRYSFRGFDRPADLYELKDPRILRNLVRIMGERHLMLSVMRDRLNEEMVVTIGRENGFEELADFSIITHRFSAADHNGLLGVLGPTRMSYQLVLALLSATAEELRFQV